MSPVRSALVLAGGLGTRLRSVVPDVPKPMAPIGGRPFLAYLLDVLVTNGIEEVVISAGYKAEAILSLGARYRSLSLSFVVEEQPLGTGGAIKFAARGLSTDPLLVLNGDTLFAVDIQAMAAKHHEHQAAATMALRKLSAPERYDIAQLEQDRITGFQPGKGVAEGWINGGIYLLGAGAIAAFPKSAAFSFERDFLPGAVKELRFLGYPSDGYFIDVGIPEDYRRAEREAHNWKQRWGSPPGDP